MELVHHAPGVAARVGGIIPGAVVHHSPGHELSARIVRIAIVVEKIGQGKTPDSDRVAGHGTLAGKLVLVALDVFLFRAEAEVVSKIEPGDVGFRSCGRDSGKLAVGRVGDSVDAAESSPAGDLRIEVELGICTETKTEEQRRGEGRVAFGMVLKTQRPLIGSIERAVVLADGGGLIVEVPILAGILFAARWLGRYAAILPIGRAAETQRGEKNQEPNRAIHACVPGIIVCSRSKITIRLRPYCSPERGATQPSVSRRGNGRQGKKNTFYLFAGYPLGYQPVYPTRYVNSWRVRRS